MANIGLKIYWVVGFAVMLWVTHDFLERLWGVGAPEVREDWPIALCLFWAFLWPILLAEHLITRKPKRDRR